MRPTASADPCKTISFASSAETPYNWLASGSVRSTTRSTYCCCIVVRIAHAWEISRKVDMQLIPGMVDQSCTIQAPLPRPYETKHLHLVFLFGGHHQHSAFPG